MQIFERNVPFHLQGPDIDIAWLTLLLREEILRKIDKYCMFFTLHILQLLRQINKYAGCLQLYICINITPTCFGGQATIIRGHQRSQALFCI
jgi:hypothetical protein